MGEFSKAQSRIKLNEQVFRVLLDKRQSEEVCLKKVKYLVYLGADVDARYESDGVSLLKLAQNLKKEKVASFLRQKGAREIGAPQYKAREMGEKIFKLGANDKEEIERLFLLGADLEVKNILGDSVFLDAVRNSKYQKINILLDLGVDINAVNKAGRNALFYAVKYPSESLFLNLLERGIDVNRVDNDGCNSLFGAIGCPASGERLQILIDKGVNLNQKRYDSMLTPLELACLWDNSHDALMLIENGADVNVKNDKGKMPLIDVVCSSRMKVEVLEAMLERGADIDYDGYMGKSPLIWALHYVKSSDINSWKKVALLIEYGAKISDSEQKIIDDNSRLDGFVFMIEDAFVKREERLKRIEEEKKEEKECIVEEVKDAKKECAAEVVEKQNFKKNIKNIFSKIFNERR